MSSIAAYQQWIEREISKQKYGKHPESLYEPIRYLMGIGGKRLRPLLTLLAYSFYKDDVKRIVPYATAVEVFHNFTLMHDDIMDQAPLRRGNATVHEKWNVNTAILSGDVMLVKVYDMFLTLESRQVKPVLEAFNRCAAGVCEGQQWDMEFETTPIVSEKEYINMIRLKTAVLLGFSLELGAILAGAPKRDREILRDFGTNIGIAFQLKDDLLDAYADPKKFGKQVGGDIISNKKTWLLLKALERSKGKTRQSLEALLTAKKFNKKEKVNAVKEIYNALDIPALAAKKADQYFEKAFRQLQQIKVFQADARLAGFVETLAQRQS